MSSLNKVQIIGRLGQDPESKFMPSGEAVCNISVATSERWKDKNTGEQREATEWVRVVMFGKLAEIATQYLTKGSLAYFEGKMKTRKWTDQQGVERHTTEVHCNEMKMLGSKQDGQQNGQSQAPAQQQRAPQNNATNPSTPQQPAGFDDFSDDIPF